MYFAGNSAVPYTKKRKPRFVSKGDLLYNNYNVYYYNYIK